MREGVGPGSAMAVALDLLKADRRRLAIDQLREYDLASDPAERVTIEVKELGKAVAAAERDVEEHELSRDEYRSTETALRQTHLPKLHEHGLVDYDDRAQMVTATDLTKQAGLLMAGFESYLQRSGLDDLQPGGR